MHSLFSTVMATKPWLSIPVSMLLLVSTDLLVTLSSSDCRRPSRDLSAFSYTRK